MELYIDGINGIKNFSLDLKKITIIGGINSTRKSTVLDILNIILDLYNTRENTIIEDFLENSNWRLKMDLLDRDSVGLLYTYSELLESESIVELVAKLNDNSVVLRKYVNYLPDDDFIRKYIVSADVKEISSDEILSNYLETKKMKLSYSFSKKAKIALREKTSKFELISFYKELDEEASLVINNFDKILITNEITKNDVTFKKNFESTSFPQKWDYKDDTSLLDLFIDLNFSVERDRTNGRFYVVENGSRFPIDKSASGMKVFSFLENIHRGCLLYKNDWLILDEPDVHLHPNWQIVFTKIIDYIVSELNVNVVFSTHNSLTVEHSLKIEGVQVILMENQNNCIIAKVCSNKLEDNELLDNLGEAFYVS